VVAKFALNIPREDIIIKEATLSIYPYASYYEGENGPKSLFLLTKDWDESSVLWNTPWTTGGGDFSTPAIASNSNSSYNVWEDYEITSAIKDMVENGADNFGFIFKFDSMTPKKGVSIHSSESAVEDKRPKLTITYEIPTEIVSPIIKQNIQIHIQKTSDSYMINVPELNNYTVSMYDLQGKQLNSFAANGSKQWHVLPAPETTGMHIISINHAGKTFTKKFWFVR
jgi:hypothetical protein